MADILEQGQRPLRFVYGRPEMVEAEIARDTETYALQNLYFYVAEGHLEVCATLIHMKEIRKAALLQGQIPPGLKMRPN